MSEFSHTYKDVSNNKGSQFINGLKQDTPFFSVGDVTEFEDKDFKVVRVKRLFVSGLPIYQYEVSEIQPVAALQDALQDILKVLEQYV